jgi:cytoskeletal protein CcmA (bactofilin family)
MCQKFLCNTASLPSKSSVLKIKGINIKCIRSYKNRDNLGGVIGGTEALEIGLLSKSLSTEAKDMKTSKHVVGVVGSYRKGGYIDSTVNEVLSVASAPGAPVLRRALLQGLIVIGLGMLLAGILPPHALGQSEAFESENVTLKGSHTDMQFLAGQSVRISANVADDVFAAGRDVTFDSATVKNAIVAGYDVELRNGNVADMITAAANVKIAGTIEDDLVAAARSIRVSSDGTIGGDARFAAEIIDMEGRIGGNMRAAAARITITGKISGKADLLAQRIVIAPGAAIAGDLIYRSDVEPEIAEGATIGGKVRRIEIDKSNLTAIGFSILGIGMFIAFSWTVATFLLIIIVQLAFPSLMAAAAGQLQTNLWSNLGRGIAGLLLTVAVTGFLFASILAIPIGVALLFGIALVWLLGLVAVSNYIGLLIRRVRRASPADIQFAGRIGWAIAGAIVLGIVTLIPFVGGTVAGLAIAAGFGAAAAELWKRLRTA